LVAESITATEGGKRGFDYPAPIVVEISRSVLMLHQWDVSQKPGWCLSLDLCC